MPKVLDRHGKRDRSMVAALDLVQASVIVDLDVEASVIFVQNSIAVGWRLIFLIDVN